jgi:hypothetical protein
MTSWPAAAPQFHPIVYPWGRCSRSNRSFTSASNTNVSCTQSIHAHQRIIRQSSRDFRHQRRHANESTRRGSAGIPLFDRPLRLLNNSDGVVHARQPATLFFLAKDSVLCRSPIPVILEFSGMVPGLPLESDMSEIAFPSTYNEPTVMWRMRHANGRRAQATIEPTNSGTRVLWFMNDRPLDVRHFADWTSAIEWTDRLRAQQWTVGWRLSDDI